ncbi:HNH endonuclease [Paenibacillus thiaminolyticus]|uniref:HNH endonuclease n=1 Tax=Paenibacillus thiaminolyticus TaxID=49283 RepID=UPI00232F9EF6|nr:HNH endonuclease [Paenibacillus thiaminolyticus]WCF06479.1 HNH endonuclease [Paenibacillus thiaminolyticus]
MMIGFDQIRIQSPYRLQRIEDVRLVWKPNEHGRLVVRGYVEDSDHVKAVLGASSHDEIHLYEKQGQSENAIFKGSVTDVRITHTNGVYAIHMEGTSCSHLMDSKRKRRSFQDAGMTYAQLVEDIIQTYPGYDVIHYAGETMSIGEPVFQYDETDWELLTRLASHFHAVLVCDILEAKPRFAFGMPEGRSHELPDDLPYIACRDLAAFQRAGGYEAGLHPADFYHCEIESGARYAIGDDVMFRNKRLAVSEVSARMDRGQFVYTYRLSRREGIRQERLVNPRLTGLSLEGEVLAVQGEQVQLRLDIDKEQAASAAHWFPFAPPTGNAMYCMPKAGTHATLYLPDATGSGAVVTGCVRKNGDSCAKTGDPNIRYFGTEHGSELELSPTAINVVSGSKEPLKLSFDDATGVTMTSHRKLLLNAKDDISLYTPKRIRIHAQSQVLVKKLTALSGFSIENEYHLLGEHVAVVGRDRTEYAPYEDEPQEGEAPKFDWGKLWGNVLAGLAVVAVVTLVAVATVATAGAGAVVIAAVASTAAISGTAAVAGKAISDIRRGEVSDVTAYMWDAFRDTTIGAVSGAVFGPFGGIWASMGGRMTFQGMVGAAESIMRQAMDGEELSWTTTLIDAAISFGTAGLLDPKVVKPVGGFIKKQAGNTTRWISDSAGDISRKFSNYMGGLSQNGNTLARIYIENEQKGLAGLAKEFGEALKKDLSHLGSNAREQLEKLRNSLNLPPGYQLAGVPHMGNKASDLFKNMSKELKESLDGLKSKLDNVMRSSSGGNHPRSKTIENRTANLENIKEFAKGNKKFENVLDDYALIYGDIVKSNKPWSWQDDFIGRLSSNQRKMIKERALELHPDIPKVEVKKIEGLKFGYADFKKAGVVLHEDVLPKELWKATDDVQFKWLNDRLPNKVQPEGTTWHHNEESGLMQLVPFGIHNITKHNGGRTKGHWADAPRH